MPSIDDLKSDNKSTRFVPTIEQGTSTVSDGTVNQKLQAQGGIKRANARINGMGISQGESKSTIYPNGSAKGIVLKANKGAIPNKPAREERVAADFSGVPAQNDDFEKAGIDVRESITKDILGEGGPFEKWKAEKMKEYTEYMEKAEEEEALAEFEDVNSTKASDPNNDDDLEEEYSEPSITSYRQIDIMEEDEDMDQKEQQFEEESLVVEDTFEELVEEEPEEEEEYDDPQEEFNDDLVKVEEPVTNEIEEIEYAVPEEGVSVDAFDNAQEIESIEEEEVPVLTRSVMSIPVEEDEEDSTVSISSDDETSEEDIQETEILLKSMIKEKIAPVSKKLDISSFTVAKKAVTSNNIFQATQAAVAKWVLPTTGIVVSMREMSGADLEKLREFMVDNNNPDMRRGLRIVYDHIVSPKPQSYEQWLKTIALADFEHLFMAVHIASFGEANYIPLDCTNPACGKPYLTDSIKILDMVKFKDDESKAKFWDLYNSDAYESKGLYTTEIVPMSDNFAIGFKEPSLYDVYIESSYYSPQFQEKYSTTINFLPYIDAMYVIDKANRSLVPIGWTTFENNLSKTFRSKVMKYDKVLGTLSSDQHVILNTYATKISERTNWFTYQIPATTCIHCGHEHAVVENQNPSSLVFLRNRLTLLATT